jgi:hypothetical protein
LELAIDVLKTQFQVLSVGSAKYALDIFIQTLCSSLEEDSRSLHALLCLGITFCLNDIIGVTNNKDFASVA